MARPRELPLTLDPRQPLHAALYRALREAMLSGRLPPRAALPSTRDLAAQLGVARGTVVAVFEQLKAEGYLGARRGAGTHVSPQLPDARFQARAPAPTPAKAGLGPRLSRCGRALTSSPFGIGQGGVARPFRAHFPAVDLFPTERWARLVARHARVDEALWLGSADPRGHLPLREAIAEHLRVSRAVRAKPEQIVIVPSTQLALDLAVRLLVNPGEPAWIE